jgi:lipopolysaccharide export system protein LptA
MIRFVLPMLVLGMSLCASEQLKIVADEFTANEKAGYTVFEGNVHIKKGSDELNASRVEVHIDSERTPIKYIAEGSASFFIKTEDNSTYRGRAQRVVFLPLEQEYRFYGDVHLKQLDQHKQIDGEEVVVNISKGTATARGAKKQPVIMIFNLPEDTKQ